MPCVAYPVYSSCARFPHRPSLAIAQTGSGTIRGTRNRFFRRRRSRAPRSLSPMKATNLTQAFRTNEQGIYVVPFLPPGDTPSPVEKPACKRSAIPISFSALPTISPLPLTLQVGADASQDHRRSHHSSRQRQ